MAVNKKEIKEKPLEKMTVKDLREIAKEIPEITGVSGMNKPELLVAIREAKGIAAEPIKKKAPDSIRNIKKKIQDFKTERENAVKAKDKKKATIYRRRIARLKKKTRRAA